MRSRRAVIVIASVAVALVAAVVVAAVLRWGPFARSSDPAGEATSPAATSPADMSPAESTEPAPSAEPTTPLPTTQAPVPVPDPTEVPSDPPQDDGATEPGEAPTGGGTTVVITYADWVPETSEVEVGAYAAVVEEGGTCTLTLTGAGASATRTNDALTDVSTVSCGGFLIPGSELSTGTWSAVVTYASPSFSGTSSPVEVSVP